MPLPGEENLDPSLNAPLPEEPMPEPEEQGQGPGVTDRIQDAKQRYEGAKERVGQAKKGLRGVEKEDVKKAMGKKVATRSSQEVAKAGVKQVEKQAIKQVGAKAVGTAVGTAVTTVASAGWALVVKAALWLVTNKTARKVLMGVIIGIAAFLILIAVLFALSALGVMGVRNTPTTAADKYQATTLAGMFGDQAALRTTIMGDSSSLVTALSTVKARADKTYSSDKATNAKAAIDKITANLAIIKNLTDNTARAKLADTILGQLQDLRKNYPELTGYGAVNGSYLPVPGVREGREGECGYASTFMIILYYDPGYTNSQFYNPLTHSIKAKTGGESCVTPGFINTALNGTGPTDWTWASGSQTTLDDVKKSLAGGDPVIMYSKIGMIYGNFPHIFVIVGYDPKDDTFIINNPNTRTVGLHTKTPNGKTLTSARLKQYFGDSSFGGHSFTIRGKYL